MQSAPEWMASARSAPDPVSSAAIVFAIAIATFTNKDWMMCLVGLSPLTDRELEISYKPRELYISELQEQIGGPDRGANARRYMAELHERLINPLYPLAFMCIAFAALSRPRTTRQSRASAIAIAALLIIAVRVAGMGLNNAIRASDAAIPALYALPLAVSAISLAFAFGLHRWIGLPFRRRRPVPA